MSNKNNNIDLNTEISISIENIEEFEYLLQEIEDKLEKLSKFKLKIKCEV